MGKSTGAGEGRGSSKIAPTALQQNMVRRATKQRNRQTKGTMQVIEHIPGTKLDAPGAIAARRKAAYDKARAQEWRKQRAEAILKDRRNEYQRKGKTLLALREQMNQTEDDYDRLRSSLKAAAKDRQVTIKAAMRKLENRLKGMQRKRDSLETRVSELDRALFGEKVSA